MTNGEKFKNAQARTKAFDDYCERQDSNCKECPLSGNNKLSCRFQWLDLEAEEEEKPMNCPYCGGKCKAAERITHFVECRDCSYRSRDCFTKAEAIAAHNRICKAVAAYKESEVK